MSARNGFRLYWKAFFLLTILYVTGRLVPSGPTDPWGILNGRKVLQLVFALSLIQILGDVFLRFLGNRTGAVVLGFFGGLVSSTALTASIAKETKTLSEPQAKAASIAFLSGTLAMLAEAVFLVLYGAPDFHPILLVLFAGPITMTVVLILASVRGTQDGKAIPKDEGRIDFKSVIKLTVFIVIALALSKLLEHFFGEEALLPLTLIVSFFEIHGSVIANVQLHDSGLISVQLLGDLIAVSFAASFISKLLLVMSLGGPELKRRAIRWTFLIGGATLVSWVAFRFL
jgi:uncharacterized membrane protein (DUF4010 family)